MTTVARSLVVLRSRCRHTGFLWCRVTLTVSALTLAGMTLRGAARRRIPLEEVQEESWQSFDERGARLLVRLRNGDVLDLQLRGAAIWKLAIDEQLKLVEARSADAARYVHRSYYHGPDPRPQLA